MKWGNIKKADQQIQRMDKKGVKTDAAETYRNARQAIRESSLSRAEKAAAAERLADKFIKSGMGTVSGIREAFSKNRDAKTKKAREWAGDDVTKMAAFIDASKNQRATMLARHYAGSDAVQQIAEMTTKNGKSNPKLFYEMSEKITNYVIRHGGNVAPDRISTMLNRYMEESGAL